MTVEREIYRRREIKRKTECKKDKHTHTHTHAHSLLCQSSDSPGSLFCELSEFHKEMIVKITFTASDMDS